MTGSLTTVSLLGSTGSIGTQTIDVVAAEPDRFRISVLGAGSDVVTLAEQARSVRPDVVVVADRSRAAELRSLVASDIEVDAGPDAFAAAAGSADVVVNAVVGFAGLPVTMAALRNGRRLALANKESLIAAGPVVRTVRDTPGAEIVPVDSEHCAVHQCLRSGDGTRRLRRIVLTASGGPFRGRTAADLADVTREDALAHPTWSMGPKITIDSSTLMNKGLEVIEAHELFDVDYDDIDVVVHPQSIVHSMVTFVDGATIAKASPPSMKLPIALALGWPDRVPGASAACDFSTASQWTFEPVDDEVFPAIEVARRAGKAGGSLTAVFNAANEVAAQGFLDGVLRFPQIVETVARVIDDADQWRTTPGSVDEIGRAHV